MGEEERGEWERRERGEGDRNHLLCVLLRVEGDIPAVVLCKLTRKKVGTERTREEALDLLHTQTHHTHTHKHTLHKHITHRGGNHQLESSTSLPNSYMLYIPPEAAHFS